MAKILTTSKNGMHRVVIQGRLSAKDLGRLERVCGPALEQAHLALEIRLRGVTQMDESARIYLARLASRGAVIDAR